MVHQNLTHKLAACLVCILLFTLGAGSQEAHFDVQYRVTDLGTLPACDTTYATSVNDEGWVTGYAYRHVRPGHGDSIASRPFAWHNGKLTELPTLGGKYGQALAINSQGDIAGYATTGDFVDHPVIWSQSQQFAPTRLSDIPGEATCLLDDGTAAGYVFRDKKNQAAVWKDRGTRSLGDPMNAESVCNDMNSRGTAVGFVIPAGHRVESEWSPGDRHAARWKEGQQNPMPELGGALSECKAINEAGTAVGWSDTKNGRSACRWQDGKGEILPSPEGFKTEAYSINREGTIVGEAVEQANKEGWKWLAYIWKEGKGEDLNRLIPTNSGWKLSVASHISNSGLIVGYGHCDKYAEQTWRAFLLTPIKE